MPSPFPGIDPYLEHPDFWQETHHWFIVALADSIMPQIRPKYEIAIKQRIYKINYTNDSNGDSLLVDIPAEVYAFNVRDSLPVFLLPLREKDVEPIVNLPELLAGIYDRAGYDDRSDYDREPIPSLAEEDRIWAKKLLQEKGLRDN